MARSNLFIILEDEAVVSRRATFSAGAVGRPGGTPAKLVIEEMTESEAVRYRGRPGVRMARAMPVALVKPMSRSKSPVRSRSSWGIPGVGAHDCGYDGEGVLVAVLDTGINAEHPAFNGMKINAMDFTRTGIADEDGHGTHCAATIFGQPVDGTRIGIAPGIRHALIAKVIGGDGDGTASVCRAIHWALDSGAHIISMSLGFDFAAHAADIRASGVPEQVAFAQALEDYRDTVRLFDSLSTYAGARRSGGALLVAAAGNESLRHEEQSYSVGVAPPANATGTISVGAIGCDGSIAGFSNEGATLCAPGVDIVSADAEGRLTAMTGTSMAAPHVAGLAALWAQYLIESGTQLTAERLRNELIRSCKPLDQSAPLVGMGVPQAPVRVR